MNAIISTKNNQGRNDDDSDDYDLSYIRWFIIDIKFCYKIKKALI